MDERQEINLQNTSIKGGKIMIFPIPCLTNFHKIFLILIVIIAWTSGYWKGKIN